MFEFLFGKRRKSKRRKTKVRKMRRVRRTRFGDSPRLAPPPPPSGTGIPEQVPYIFLPSNNINLACNNIINPNPKNIGTDKSPIPNGMTRLPYQSILHVCNNRKTNFGARYANMIPGGGREAKGANIPIPYEKTGMKMQQATILPGVTTPSSNPASGTIVPPMPPSTKAFQEVNVRPGEINDSGAPPPGGAFPGFGRKFTKKRCVKVRRSKRDKRKKCRSKKCSVRSRLSTDRRRKCRTKRAKTHIKQAALMAARKVEQRGGSPVEQAEAAAAVVADIAESYGADPKEVTELVTTTATEIAESQGASPEETAQAVEVSVQNVQGAIDYDSAMEYEDLNRAGLAFGNQYRFGRCQRCNRRSHFGAECKDLARTEEECTNYTLNGMYPCYLTKAGCRKRIDKQSRHLKYVVGQTKSKVVREALREELRTREIGTQTDPVIKNSLDDIDSELDFGKKRKYRRRKVHKGKLPKRIRKLCKKCRIKCTKKVGGKRVYKTLNVIKKQLSKKMKRIR